MPVAENLKFNGSVFFDQAIYHVGDTATAQWSVVNAGDAVSQDGEVCTVSVTDPTGVDVTPNPSSVNIPALGPLQQTELLTAQFQVAMRTDDANWYTIYLSLSNGQSTQDTATVNP